MLKLVLSVAAIVPVTGKWSSPPVSLPLCSSYLAACNYFNSLTGCTSPLTTTTTTGCLGGTPSSGAFPNGTLDGMGNNDPANSGTARCGCSAPYQLNAAQCVEPPRLPTLE